MATEREAKIKTEIEDLLAARVGRDKVRVSVTVETDREAETITERSLDPKTRVTVHSDTEEISDSSEGGGGNVTVASNLPDGEANTNNQRQSARTESRERVNYDYTETRRETVRAAGAIRKVSVAVLVDGVVEPGPDGTNVWQPRSAEELQALRELVVAAVGFDESRGDIVTVDSMAFQPDATPGALVEASPILRFVERNAMTLIQLVFLAIVVIVLGMTVIRPLLSRTPEQQDLPQGLVLDQNGQPVDPAQVAMLNLPEGAQLPDVAPAEEEEEPALPPDEVLRELAQERPEQTASMLKHWLKDTGVDEEAAA